MSSTENDLDLPECLDSSIKREVWALSLAETAGYQVSATRVPFHDGGFSRTVIARIQDGSEIVIQFRRAPLDITPFSLAREHLGDLIPDVRLVPNDTLGESGIWVYMLSCIPGMTWLEVEDRPSFNKVAILRSLGSILSKGFIVSNSNSATGYISHHLGLIMASKDSSVTAFRDTAQHYLTALPMIETLPLFVSHHDLNEGNIMVGDDYQITGIIDWENSRPLPFGMGFCRIHGHAGEFDEGLFCMPDDYEAVEGAFWQSIWDGLPEEQREDLNGKLDLVQTSVGLGMLLETFGLKADGTLYAVIVRALPKLLTYRIPYLRSKGESPYQE